jgi:hypothetical protein
MGPLADVMDSVTTLDWISGLVGQDGLQEVPSNGRIGIQECRPRGINHINRVRELHGIR